MQIKIINKCLFEDFISNSIYKNYRGCTDYKSYLEYYGNKCELIGYYDNDLLIGVSLISYVKVFKKSYLCNVFGNFVDSFANVLDLKNALISYFSDKGVIAVKLFMSFNLKLLEQFKSLGFELNINSNRFQYKIINDKNDLGVSTKKNIEEAFFRGVKYRICGYDEYDYVTDVCKVPDERKKYYNYLIDNKMNIEMGVLYVDKSEYFANLKSRINELELEQVKLNHEIESINVGHKLLTKKNNLVSLLEKYHNELKSVKDMEDTINIGAMILFGNNDILYLLDYYINDNYRFFNPKYAMYSILMDVGFNSNISNLIIEEYKSNNITLESVESHFSDCAFEYIDEIVLPINKFLYKILKITCRDRFTTKK